jgi:hypothetical protein
MNIPRCYFIPILSLLAFNIAHAQTTKSTIVRPAALLARQTAVDAPDPDTLKITWQIISIIDPGDVSAKVGTQITQTREKYDAHITGFNAKVGNLALFAAGPDARVPGIIYLEELGLETSGSPAETPDAIAQREKTGYADVQALRQLPSPYDRRPAYAKLCRETKTPCAELVDVACQMAPGSETSPRMLLPLIDGLSFLTTRQDVPTYVRLAALTALQQTVVAIAARPRTRSTCKSAGIPLTYTLIRLFFWR